MLIHSIFSAKRSQAEEKVTAHCKEQSRAVLHCHSLRGQRHVVDLGTRARWIRSTRVQPHVGTTATHIDRYGYDSPYNIIVVDVE